jgi:hypothetical protein
VTARNPAVTRLPGPAVLTLAVLAAAALLAGCSSGSPPAGRAAAAPASAIAQTCSQVSAVLSDGPDPQADPVGYAEAQILPLEQVHTSDLQLRAAINGLAGAYREYFASNGASRAATAAVAVASERVDAICPGATS